MTGEAICGPLCPFVACATCTHQWRPPETDDPPLFDL